MRTARCAVAVPNYRLTTPESGLQHPAHAEDLLAFLEFARAWAGPDGDAAYDPARLYVVGHSCSAHMMASILLAPSDDAPVAFPIGVGRLIKGWDQGLVGVPQGSRVLLVVPPDLGYGAKGSAPKIPGNATLVFVVDVLGVAP